MIKQLKWLLPTGRSGWVRREAPVVVSPALSSPTRETSLTWRCLALAHASKKNTIRNNHITSWNIETLLMSSVQKQNWDLCVKWSRSHWKLHSQIFSGITSLDSVLHCNVICYQRVNKVLINLRVSFGLCLGVWVYYCRYITRQIKLIGLSVVVTFHRVRVRKLRSSRMIMKPDICSGGAKVFQKLQNKLLEWVFSCCILGNVVHVKAAFDFSSHRKTWLSTKGSPSSRITHADFTNERDIPQLELSGFKTRPSKLQHFWKQ